MKIQSIKTIANNRRNTGIKRTENNSSNISFGNKPDKYSKTEGLTKGFLYGLLSFWGIIAILVIIEMYKYRKFFR